MAAPISRNDTNVQELTAGLFITIFDSGAISPQAILAANMAVCPFNLFVSKGVFGGKSKVY